MLQVVLADVGGRSPCILATRCLVLSFVEP